MATSAKTELGVDELQVLADAGYSNGEQLEHCEEQGIEATLPVNRAVSNQGDYYQKSHFTYDREKDQFTCPAEQLLTYQTYNSKKKQHLYTRTGCNACPLQSQCTSADKRWITRHFNEDALNRSQQREECVFTHPHLPGFFCFFLCKTSHKLYIQKSVQISRATHNE